MLTTGHLDQRMRDILAQLELISHGSTANWSPTGRSRSGSHGRPPGDERPPHIYWRERWERAVRDDEEWTIEAMLTNCEEVVTHRRKVITSAQTELDSLRKRPEVKVQGETGEELEKRIVRDGEGEPVDRVALAMRCTPTFVRKARLKAGRSVVTGKAPKDAVVEAADQHDRARTLAEDGHTERQIAWLTGLPKTTLRRILGRAA
jgi:hypothetical protein